MKKVEKDTFFLNGIEEKVIAYPKHRDDLIEITFGGKDIGFTEKIPLSIFEEQTDYYVEGLEPAVDVDVATLVESFEGKMIAADYTLDLEYKKDDERKVLSAGGCKFSTHRNVRMGASFIVYDKGDSEKKHDYYAIHTMKNDGSKTVYKEERASDFDLEEKLNQAVKLLESYVSTRVQILNKPVDKNQTTREVSSDGYPMLKAGETLSEYFDSVSDIGGIVVNSQGKYQAFHSYVAFNGKDILHHDTKDYKTLGGAVKLLNKYGFGANGRMLDNMSEDFRSEFTDAVMRDLSATVGQDNWGSFVLGDDGWVEITDPIKIEDEVRGFTYNMPYTYTDELSGQTITRMQEIKNCIDMSAYNVSRFFTVTAHELKKEIETGDAIFDVDNRTVIQKESYHSSRYKYHAHRCKWMQERVDSQEARFANVENLSERDQKWLDSDYERLNETKALMEHHQKRYQELKIEGRKLEETPSNSR